MKVFLYEIPGHADQEHQINKRRDQGKQNLEDQNVRQRDQSQRALARKNSLVFEDRLQNSEGPAKALAHERIRARRSFGKSERLIFVLHSVPVAQQRHRQIGILGNRVHMVASGFADCFHPPCPDGSRHHADRAHGIERTPFKILAGDVFERLPAGPEIHPVADLRIPRHGGNLRIEEMGHKAMDRIGRNNGIGIDADENFRIADVLQPEIERLGLAAIGLGEDHHSAGTFFRGKSAPDNFQSTILRTVVDDDHAHIGVVGIERAVHRALDNLLLVIRRNQHGNSRPVKCNLLGRSVDMRKKTVVDGKHADRNQAPGHQNVPEEKDDRDRGHRRAEEPEADPVQPSRPIFVGRERRHNIGFRLPHQLIDRDKGKSAGASAIDNQRERKHRSLAIPAAVVHQNDVAACLIVLLTRRQMLQHRSRNLLRSQRWIIIPVFGVEFVADRDVAHALREFKRLHLVFGIGLGINRVWRTEQHCANTQPAGEQALGEIHLHPHVAGADGADVGMRKGMVTDLVAFTINALCQTTELLYLDSNEKKRSRRLLAFEDIENFRCPFRIGTVVKS